MRWFETRGPVYPEDNYVVARTEELVDFVEQEDTMWCLIIVKQQKPVQKLRRWKALKYGVM